MSGFVDVSHMSNEQVRRMGHADDYDEPMNYRNPYAFRKPTPAKPKFSYSADDVWAAAYEAFVRNGKQYIKLTTQDHQANRLIAERLLANPIEVSEESRQVGGVMRRYFQGLTFKLIEGKPLTPFMQGAYEAASKDTITNNFDLAVIVSLPATYEKSTKRDDVDRRIQWARGGYAGEVGDKIEQQVEVLKRIWSQKWNTWFYNVINDKDQVMFFSFMKEELKVGDKIEIQATVKGHRDNTTQLNRVKVI